MTTDLDSTDFNIHEIKNILKTKPKLKISGTQNYIL